MHNVYIRAHRDPEQKWTTLPFIAIDDVVFSVIDTWPPEWRTPYVVVRDETKMQKQKVVAKRLAQQKRNE